MHARWSYVHVRVHFGAAVCTLDGAMCMLGAFWSSSVHAKWNNVHVKCTLAAVGMLGAQVCSPVAEAVND